jgi:hypothetical protein
MSVTHAEERKVVGFWATMVSYAVFKEFTITNNYNNQETEAGFVDFGLVLC